jgi:hypothetical protein
MNQRIFAVMCILTLILSFSFATITIQAPTVTPTYTTDKTYMDFPIDLNSIVTGTGTDLNSDVSCWYRVSNSDTNFAATWLNDRNTCTLNDYTSAGVDDFNFSMVVQNGAKDANTISDRAYYWLDSNAPITTSSFTDPTNNGGTMTLTCTDQATNTGNGVGCASTQYRIDDGSWTAYTSPVVLVALPTIRAGTHTIDYNSTDNFGNTRNAETVTVYIGSMNGAACGVLNILPIVLVAALLGSIVIIVLLGILRGEPLVSNLTLAIMAVGAVAAAIILFVIFGNFMLMVC